MSAQESGVGCPQDFSPSWFDVGEVEEVERSNPQFCVSTQLCRRWRRCYEGKRQSVWKNLRNLSVEPVLLNLSYCFHFSKGFRGWLVYIRTQP